MWSFIHYLISPKKFLVFSTMAMPCLIFLFVTLVSYGVMGGLVLVPADYLQGDGFRIIYVHAPCAFLSLFIYTVMAGAAFAHLVWQLKLSPLVLRHSAPIGATFTFLALFTGSLWGKPMWGTWWIWDARLTSELILLFLYLGIIFFQSATTAKKNGSRASSILILVGFIDIPIIHFSVYWWNTLHQGATLTLFSPPTIDATMVYPLLAMIGAFLCYYAIMLLMCMRYELAKEKKRHALRNV